MRIVKKIIRNLHRYVFTAFLSAVIWAWVFTFVTDAPRAKKVTLFLNVPQADCLAIEEELDKVKPDGIRLVKVHTFEYAAFLTSEVDAADIYVIAESDIEKNLERLSPIPADFLPDRVRYEVGGTVYALRVYDKETRSGAAAAFVNYVPSAESGLAEEDYYLCFNAKSIHLGSWNGSADSAAIGTAERLFLLK